MPILWFNNFLIPTFEFGPEFEFELELEFELRIGVFSNGDNNRVTGLHNSYTRVITSLQFGSNEYVF